MFDVFRNHTKVLMFVLFLLVIPSFVLFGIDGYSRMDSVGKAVATVDGHKITQAEWDAAHQEDMARVRDQNPTVNLSLLDSPEFKYATLERLVRERALAIAAQKDHLVASDAQLAAYLKQDPSISQVLRPDGSLDTELYKSLLANQGLSPEGFEARVRADLSAQQVMQGLLASSFAPPALAKATMNALFQQREVQFAALPTANYTTQVQVSDADVEAYYKANEARFRAPDEADIEYLVLDLDAVKNAITLSEQDLKDYYDQNAQMLSGKEERQASHILINAPASMPAAEREQAKAKAQAILDEVRKAPEQFGAIAKRESQDPGSAAQDGDLGLFARGAMVKPFEDAAFSLQKGQISDLVETEYGYHIIRVTDIRTPAPRPFEEMRSEIEANLRTEQAQKRFSEMAEAFRNMVYEQADSLQPTAEALKLPIQKAQGVTRQPAAGATGPTAHPALLQALFSPSSIEKKQNTEATEIGSNQIASARITAFRPAHVRPLAEVKDTVRNQLVNERAAALARKDGETKLSAWRANPAASSLPAPVVVSRETLADLPQPAVEAALRADTRKLPAFVPVDLGTAGYGVVRVNKVIAPTLTDQESAELAGQYAQAWGAAEAQAYYNTLKDKLKVRINVPAPQAGASAPAAGT